MNTQVKASHYFNSAYNDNERLASYKLQIKEIIKTKPKNVLEIGIGNGYVAKKIKSLGVKVITADIDRNLHPDIVADVTKIPLKDKTVDTIACFQVMEHLPFAKFSLCLKEMKRVAKNYVLFSVPDVSRQHPLLMPFFKKIVKNIVNYQEKTDKHLFDGQHYWEIGKRNYPLSKIVIQIEKTGLIITKTFRPKNLTNRRFFVLKV